MMNSWQSGDVGFCRPTWSGFTIHNNWPLIVTVDRDGTGKRRKKSKRFYLANGGRLAISGQQLDEYPQAVFKENAGRAHVKPIDKSDNRGSGGSFKNFITGSGGRANPIYRNGDQIEIAIPDNKLFCREAF